MLIAIHLVTLIEIIQINDAQQEPDVFAICFIPRLHTSLVICLSTPRSNIALSPSLYLLNSKVTYPEAFFFGPRPQLSVLFLNRLYHV